MSTHPPGTFKAVGLPVGGVQDVADWANRGARLWPRAGDAHGTNNLVGKAIDRRHPGTCAKEKTGQQLANCCCGESGRVQAFCSDHLLSVGPSFPTDIPGRQLSEKGMA
jgi:hypothetical protein